MPRTRDQGGRGGRGRPRSSGGGRWCRGGGGRAGAGRGGVDVLQVRYY